jgi:phosphatidylglycerol---prolipoprotein diacylglyceryl transferase
VIVHSIFDLLAAATAMVLTMAVYRWRLAGGVEKIERAGLGYAVSLVAGAVLGGFATGTFNLWLSGVAGIGRSILGALAGAIAAIELFKKWRGISGSTGLIFVPAFAASVAMGRWGCFFAGLDDNTHGIETRMRWGVDFGDGIFRHPVQIYESINMGLFLAASLVLIVRRDPWFMRNGFYALVLFYAAQRFVLEFIKPYGTVIGPFNLFHLIALALICYSLAMLRMGHERARA